MVNQHDYEDSGPWAQSGAQRNPRPPFGTPTEVSVVLPAYNEENTLEPTVQTTIQTLADFLPAESFEVIIAEDGCSDRTPQIADQFAATDERVRHVHSETRLGRGGALERAFRAATGEVLVYFDTDLATDMGHLEKLVESVRRDGYDIVTGSRWIPGKEASRPVKRDIASRGFNALTRLFLRSKLRDHQCGFKAFDRQALLSLLDDVEDTHWFWDTEVLVRAQRNGYRVKEFPVNWQPKGDTKVDLVRDVIGMGGGILRTWWDLSVDPRITPRTTFTIGTVIIAIATVLMFAYLDPSTILREIRGANLVLLGAATMVYLVSWPFRGLRYRWIIERLGFDGGTGFLTGAIFISQTGNLVFPARAGDAIRVYIVKARRTIPYPTGVASIVAERVFDILTITVLAGAVLLGLLATSGGAKEVISALAGGGTSGRFGVFAAGSVALVTVLVTGIIAATAISGHSHVRQWIGRASSDVYADVLASIIERFTGDVQRVATNPRTVLQVSISGILIWTLDVLTAILVIMAIGVEVPLVSIIGVVFFAVCVGNLAKVLPLSPGGIGLYEGAFTMIVAGLTPIAVPVALGAAIVDHAIKNIVTIAGGFVAMAVFNVSLTNAVKESPDMETLPSD